MVTTTTSTPRSREELSASRLAMTYDEYTTWFDKDAGRRGEWVDGEVIRFVAATFEHEDVVGFLNSLLRTVLVRRRLGRVVGSNYELRVSDAVARLPDLVVVLGDHASRIKSRRLLGAADLVVEVISPDSVRRDRDVKSREYAALGVAEYWIVDPRPGHEAFDVLVLDEAGDYDPVVADEQGRLHSSVIPGVWVEASWLSEAELPDASELGIVMAAHGGS